MIFKRIELLTAVLVLAILVTTSVQARTGTKSTSASTATRNTVIGTDPVSNWIAYRDQTFTPVVDPVSRELALARSAVDSGNVHNAASELRLVSNQLRTEAGTAAKIERFKSQLEIDNSPRTASRLSTASLKIAKAADALDAGQITTGQQLDQTIDIGTRADMEQRWLVTDTAHWYPLTAEPHHQFELATADYAKHDYKAAADDVRKAEGYLRLEIARADDDSQKMLEASRADLDTLAISIDKGTVNERGSMDKLFAQTEYALALEHRTKAAEFWANKDIKQTGYEFKAAATSLDGMADWIGSESHTEGLRSVSEAHAAGDKLASGARWTRQEIKEGFDSLDSAIDQLGKKSAIRRNPLVVKLDL